jgi:hypothetical protein
MAEVAVVLRFEAVLPNPGSVVSLPSEVVTRRLCLLRPPVVVASGAFHPFLKNRMLKSRRLLAPFVGD